ncbi:MAG: glycosyltransferase 87 family protein [Acidobacteriota bacterium]
MSRRQHALVLAVLIVGGFLRYDHLLTDPQPRIDEFLYEAGFQEFADGRSPYEARGFLYPPTFAAAGAAGLGTFGTATTRSLIRAINFFGLVGILWAAVALFAPHAGPTRTWPLVVLAALGILSPGTELGFAVGNISFLAGALILVGLWQAGARPWLAGPLLSASLLIKPLAAASLPLLLVPPGARNDGGTDADRRELTRRWRRRITTALLAGGLSALALGLLLPEFLAMLEVDLSRVAKGRTSSTYRIARLLGLGEQRLPIFAAICGLSIWVLWRRLPSRRALLVGALAVVPLTTLAVWSHTLVLMFPVVALALRRLIDRRFAGRRPPADPHGRLEAVLVLGACALIYFAPSAGFATLPSAAQVLLLLPQLAAPPALAAYWFATTAGTTNGAVAPGVVRRPASPGSR